MKRNRRAILREYKILLKEADRYASRKNLGAAQNMLSMAMVYLELYAKALGMHTDGGADE